MTISIQKAQDDLQHMNDLLTRIVNLSKDVGTFHDGIDLRDQIKTSVQELKQISQTVKKEIEILKQNDEDSNATSSLHVAFEELSARVKNALPDVIQALRSADASQQGAHLFEPSPNQSNTSDSKNRPLELINTPLLDQGTLDQDTDLLEELESDVNSIMNAMREINELFIKTMKELQSQKTKIFSAENLTAEAHNQMKKGNDELDKATAHQKKSGKCLVFILIVILLIGVGIGLYFLIQYLKNKKK